MCNVCTEYSWWVTAEEYASKKKKSLWWKRLFVSPIRTLHFINKAQNITAGVIAYHSPYRHDTHYTGNTRRTHAKCKTEALQVHREVEKRTTHNRRYRMNSKAFSRRASQASLQSTAACQGQETRLENARSKLLANGYGGLAIQMRRPKCSKKNGWMFVLLSYV